MKGKYAEFSPSSTAFALKVRQVQELSSFLWTSILRLAMFSKISRARFLGLLQDIRLRDYLFYSCVQVVDKIIGFSCLLVN